MHGSSTRPAPVANTHEAPALLLTADDLARELRVSLRTLRTMDAGGRLPRPIRPGGGRSLRWRRSEIVEWIAAGAPRRDEWEDLRH